MDIEILKACTWDINAKQVVVKIRTHFNMVGNFLLEFVLCSDDSRQQFVLVGKIAGADVSHLNILFALSRESDREIYFNKNQNVNELISVFTH